MEMWVFNGLNSISMILYFYLIVEKCLPGQHLSFTAFLPFACAMQKHWLKLNMPLNSTLLCKSSRLAKWARSTNAFPKNICMLKSPHLLPLQVSFFDYLKCQCLQIKNSAQVFSPCMMPNIKEINYVIID